MVIGLLTMVFAVVVTAVTLVGGSSILGSRAATSLSSPLVDEKSASCREGFSQTCIIVMVAAIRADILRFGVGERGS